MYKELVRLVLLSQLICQLCKVLAAAPSVPYVEMVNRNSTFTASNFALQSQGISDKTYSIVSILGPKGSGKSKLINHLFNTSFPFGRLEGNVSDPGILLTSSHYNKSHPIVVLDLPGFDGQEVSPFSVVKPLEGYSALFSLAVSKIMIYNIAFEKVQSNMNSGLPFLSNIFRAYFSSFAGKQAVMNSTILFVFRNTKPKKSDIPKAQKYVLSRITELWQNMSTAMSIATPPDISEVFDIKFTDLPEPPRENLPFNEAALSNIRSIVYDTLARSEGPVPIDGLFDYFKGIWNQVITERYVNLPSQLDALAYEKADQVAKQIIDEYDDQVRSMSVNDLSDLNIDRFNDSLLQNISYFLQKYASMIAGYAVSPKQKAEFRVTLSDNSIVDYKDYFNFYSSKVVAEYQNRTWAILHKADNASELQLTRIYEEATSSFEADAISSGKAIRQALYCDSQQCDCASYNCSDVNARLDRSWSFAIQVLVNEFTAEVFLAHEATSNYLKLTQQHVNEREERSALFAAFSQALEALSNRVPMPSLSLLAVMETALDPSKLAASTRTEMMIDVVNSFVYRDHMARHVKNRFSKSFESRSENETRVFSLPSDVVFAKGGAHQNATYMLDQLMKARTILPMYSKEKEEALRNEILASLERHEQTVTTLETGALTYTGYLDYIDFGFFMALIYAGINAWYGNWLKAGFFGLISLLAFLKMVYFTFRETIWTFLDKVGCLWSTMSTWTRIISFQRLWSTSSDKKKPDSPLSLSLSPPPLPFLPLQL